MIELTRPKLYRQLGNGVDFTVVGFSHPTLSIERGHIQIELMTILDSFPTITTISINRDDFQLVFNESRVALRAEESPVLLDLKKGLVKTWNGWHNEPADSMAIQTVVAVQSTLGGLCIFFKVSNDKGAPWHFIRLESDDLFNLNQWLAVSIDKGKATIPTDE